MSIVNFYGNTPNIRLIIRMRAPIIFVLTFLSSLLTAQVKEKFLDTIPVYAINKPETLVAKPFYSIFDFDFYKDRLLLLSAEKSLGKARIELSDYSGKILANFEIPKSAGTAKHFFHDYEGYTDLICEDTIFRLDVMNNNLIVSTIPQHDFTRFILPVSDTVNQTYFYQDNWINYPQFNYYHLKNSDSTSQVLKTVCNEDLMKLYNLEYYYLKPGEQLQARRLAKFYKTDVHIVAALMSGFTNTFYYEPLYAPLYVLNDTICIFNHHNDYLYHYTKKSELIDSVKISYHHPKNWRDWKRQLIVDKTEKRVYGFFSHDGHHYLKHIDYQNGQILGEYKLKHHSAERIKIRDGYIYYVYRPFGSTQERFLYRERINSF